MLNDALSVFYTNSNCGKCTNISVSTFLLGCFSSVLDEWFVSTSTLKCRLAVISSYDSTDDVSSFKSSLFSKSKEFLLIQAP